MERPTGFEPATSSLGSWHSATELRPPDASYTTPHYAGFAGGRETGGRGGAAGRETRVSGTASAPAANRCPLTGAAHSRFAWSHDPPPRPARRLPRYLPSLIVISVASSAGGGGRGGAAG